MNTNSDTTLGLTQVQLNAQTEAKESAKYSRKFKLVIVSFFLTFICVDAFFFYMASNSHTGTVTDNAYKDGVNYNKTIAAARAEKALNWSSTIQYNKDADTLEFKVADADAAPLQGAQVYAAITRPTMAGHDFSVALTSKNGIYQAPVTFPMQGQWDIRVFVKWQTTAYQQHTRLIIQ